MLKKINGYDEIDESIRKKIEKKVLRKNLTIAFLIIVMVGYVFLDFFYYYFNPDLETIMYSFYDWRVVEDRMNAVLDDSEWKELYDWEPYKGLENYDLSDRFNLYVTEVVFNDLSNSMPEFDSEYNYIESTDSYNDYIEYNEEYDFYHFEKLGDVFYMGLFSFDEDYNEIVLEHKHDINSSNKLIIDLRGNPGGYTYVGYDFIDMFLDSGVDLVVDYYHTSDGVREEIYNSTDEKINLSPKEIVILIDENTASTAEIVAYSLGEHLGNTTLLGTTTYGKGISTYTIEDYYGAYVTVVASTFSVLDKDGNEVSYHLKGIEPDVIYEWQDDDYSADVQKLLDLVDSKLATK